MWLRWILLAASALAGLLVARDAPNFLVVEGLAGIALIAMLVVGLGLLSRR